MASGGCLVFGCFGGGGWFGPVPLSVMRSVVVWWCFCFVGVLWFEVVVLWVGCLVVVVWSASVLACGVRWTTIKLWMGLA